ncbi:MAG: hypothetical protein CVV44_09360 [Spirochaetae bacterium HGW-Spirochaetae-1]|jgi:uncharacterized membrane-anchored protein|nr:MAG: hypothetical protein CVV44_09360 [Spirochaetae bacterium HGW-Spirochaetae-1]
MTGLNKKLAAALLIPIVMLALLTLYKAVKIYSGRKVIIPITGFDPRDLLSGHYLTYRLALNTDVCSGHDRDRGNLFLCLSLDKNGAVIGSYPMEYLDEDWRDRCSAVLKGTCRRGSFMAGIERFYIPENESVLLDRAVRQGKGSLVVSIDNKGNASIKELLIDGKPWREALSEK